MPRSHEPRPRASISMGKSKTKAPTSSQRADALREAGSREEAEIEADIAAAQARAAHDDAQAKKVATNRYGRKVTEWQVVPPRRKKGAGAEKPPAVIDDAEDEAFQDAAEAEKMPGGRAPVSVGISVRSSLTSSAHARSASTAKSPNSKLRLS